MPRYNTSLASASISGATTIGSPYSGVFTEFTGTAPYTVTLPSPVLYPGQNQTFYNNTSGTVTINTPAGVFTGTGGTGTANVSCYAGNVVSITSDGTNYIVISEDGSALVATTGSFSGNLSVTGGTTTLTPSSITFNPSGVSTIDNTSIGNTTRQSGAFTTLASNGQTNFTANIASSNTSTGTLVVTGGIGASGTINASAISASSITGTLQTAAQPNLTSVNTLGVNKTSPTLKLHVVSNTNGAIAIDLIDTTTTSSLMDASSTNNMIYIRTAFNSNPASVSNAGAKWGIAFTGQPAGDNTGYPINASSSALGKSASIYAISEDTGAGYNRQVGLSFWTSGFDLNQAERVRISSTGNVYIGATTGSNNSARLTVNVVPGAPDTSGTTNNYGGLRVATTTTNSQVLDHGIYNDGAYGAWVQARNGGDFSSNSPLILNPNGGNVGIGTRDFSAGYGFNVALPIRARGMMLGNGDGSNASDNRIAINWSSGSEAYIYAQQNVPFKFGMNNAMKVQLDTNGNWIPAANDAQDLGTSSLAWRNIYTNDLHLNNESKVNGNDVDGTTGNWTIQEGSEQLYIINNKTGKKYAFMLREIE